MKNSVPFLLMLLLVFTFSITNAQKKKSPPASASGEIDGVKVEINYHQPSANDREIMGDLVPYGKVWRTGANNATTITFSGAVNVEGEELAAGTYSLFTLPGEDEWAIIFNSKADIWGTQYSDKTDVLRVSVASKITDEFVETFDISIDGNHVVLSWENTIVKFEISKG